jgi:hypothetical protein
MFKFESTSNRPITANACAAIGLAAIVGISAQSQTFDCGTVPSQETLDHTRRMVESGEWAAARGLLGDRSVPPPDLMFVAITAHIVRYDDGSEGIPQYQIDQAIDDLNGHVQDTNLRFFQLGETLFIDDTKYAEVADYDERDELIQIDTVSRTLNVYFVPDLGFAGGVATFPDEPLHGIVIENVYAGHGIYRGVFSHEVGHYFWLFHTHETAEGDECVDGSNCDIAGDLICDTPADPQLYGGNVWTKICLYFGEDTDSCNGDLYDPPTTNIMSYTPPECMDVFTDEQLGRFRTTAEGSFRSDHLHPPGACCVGGECNVTPEAECLGSWLGASTDCSNYQCALLVPDEFSTIQDAINVSRAGDTILVGPGTYTYAGAEPNSPVIRLLGRAVTLRSTDGPESTILDGEGLRQVVVCSSNESAETVIEGFTITGGDSDWGGGIFCGGSSPTFNNCIITGNTASMRGGGAYCYQGNPSFNSCVLDANISDLGGGLYTANGSPVLTGCTLKNNTAAATGGALYASSGGLSVVSSTLCHNQPNNSDGDWTGDASNLVVDYCAGCDGDVDSLDGLTDDHVDLIDLQLLITRWGSSDTAADIDRDGVVDVTDLLILLTAWGPC